MHITIGCDMNMELEELLNALPGKNKDIYEDDAEEILEQIEAEGAMRPLGAWKELTVTAVGEKELFLDGICLKAPGLAEKVAEGDKVYASLVTAGEKLNEMLSSNDDIMQGYVLGFLMSELLTMETVQVVKDLTGTVTAPHVEMLMAGIEAICPMDQQEVVAELMKEEFSELGVTVKPGGSLSPTYSSTSFFVFSDGENNLPKDWEDKEERNAFGHALYLSAGHS